MHANPELKFTVRHVSDLEREDGREEVEGHGGNLTSVLVTVALGEAGHNHVCEGGRGEGRRGEGRGGGEGEGKREGEGRRDSELYAV